MASYRTPQLLSDVRVLDLVELSGSTVRAASLLNLSQPSVSRRRRRLAAELGLVPADHLRQGDGACLRLLRRAAKRHRLDAGVWRLGGDGWCVDPLLAGASTLVAPPRFAVLQQWQALVAGHVLDAALVSGHELRLAFPGLASKSEQPLVLEDCLAMPLLQLPLLLLSRVEWQSSTPMKPWSTVLMPPMACCPGLATAVRQQQLLPVHMRSVQRGPCDWLKALGSEASLVLATPLWHRQLQRCSPEPLQPVALPKPLHLDVWLLVHQRDWLQQNELKQLALAWSELITERIAKA